jgi:hypothetical protein
MGQILTRKAVVAPSTDELMSVSSHETKNTYSEEGDNKNEITIKDDLSYRDPPMPFLGNPVNYSVMLDRYHKAIHGTRTICEGIAREVADSVCEARILPVSDDTDRVRISAAVQDRIALRKSKKDIRYNVTINQLEIQKALLYRKHALNMM